MNLYEITGPEFLKDLSIHELEELSGEIRRFLIDSISKTGGHLASNLGVVELTIALHYVFNSPKDKIFFDVGHQCYTHKILTGRASQFPTLRQYEGLSGFEKRRESIHDIWEAGHSSTSLSAALGMAVARDLDQQNYCIVPVIGDGALSSGMALEALNQIGSEKKNIIIVFNDNNMSISRNVGGMTDSFSKLRSSKTYTVIKSNVKKNLRSNDFGKSIYSGLKIFKDAIKDVVIHGGIFEEFGLDYIGPVDGHNLTDLIQILEAEKNHEGPIVIHVITKKGKGYPLCENDMNGYWHGVGPFNVKTGKPLASIPEKSSTWAGVMADTLLKLAEHDPDITAVCPAMVTGSSLEKFFARFPKRSFDCGIAEEHAATFCAGMAIAGKRPYFSVYSSFLQRAYDQINHDICRMDLPVVIGIDHAGLVGDDGETHQGIFDVGLLEPIPHLIFSQPSDAFEAASLLKTAFSQEHPFAIRYPKGIVSIAGMKEPEIIPVGTWTVFNDAESNHVAILTYGENFGRICTKVTVNTLPYTVVNCRFFKPIDKDMIDRLCKAGKALIVYESDLMNGGLGSMILTYMNEKNYKNTVKIIGIGDVYVEQGSSRQLRRMLGIDTDMVLKTAGELEKETVC
ncbi:MAG: 1-deoxy-D-xylulose-5-phosphate synthase [Solobacterium sp.]|nr:1-deoxy-D-xylulose-5-phosphate synthase [Solobacterium sp.]